MRFCVFLIEIIHNSTNEIRCISMLVISYESSGAFYEHATRFPLKVSARSRVQSSITYKIKSNVSLYLISERTWWMNKDCHIPDYVYASCEENVWLNLVISCLSSHLYDICL